MRKARALSPLTVEAAKLLGASVRLGTAFEAAALVGVPLFAEDEPRRALEAARL